MMVRPVAIAGLLGILVSGCIQEPPSSSPVERGNDSPETDSVEFRVPLPGFRAVYGSAHFGSIEFETLSSVHLNGTLMADSQFLPVVFELHQVPRSDEWVLDSQFVVLLDVRTGLPQLAAHSCYMVRDDGRIECEAEDVMRLYTQIAGYPLFFQVGPGSSRAGNADGGAAVQAGNEAFPSELQLSVFRGGDQEAMAEPADRTVLMAAYEPAPGVFPLLPELFLGAGTVLEFDNVSELPRRLVSARGYSWTLESSAGNWSETSLTNLRLALPAGLCSSCSREIGPSTVRVVKPRVSFERVLGDVLNESSEFAERYQSGEYQFARIQSHELDCTGPGGSLTGPQCSDRVTFWRMILQPRNGDTSANWEVEYQYSWRRYTEIVERYEPLDQGLSWDGPAAANTTWFRQDHTNDSFVSADDLEWSVLLRTESAGLRVHLDHWIYEAQPFTGWHIAGDPSSVARYGFGWWDDSPARRGAHVDSMVYLDATTGNLLQAWLTRAEGEALLGFDSRPIFDWWAAR